MEMKILLRGEELNFISAMRGQNEKLAFRYRCDDNIIIQYCGTPYALHSDVIAV